MRYLQFPPSALKIAVQSTIRRIPPFVASDHSVHSTHRRIPSIDEFHILID